MKTAIIIALCLLLLGLSYEYADLHADYNLLQRRLTAASSFQEQLQEQVENNGEQRDLMQAQLEILQESLEQSNNQLNGLSADLEAAQSRMNPDASASQSASNDNLR